LKRLLVYSVIIKLSIFYKTSKPLNLAKIIPSLLKLLSHVLSYGHPWAHYLGGYQDRLLGGSLGLPSLGCTTPVGVKHKDLGGEVLR
jgi:hypothetical protein